MDHDLAVEAMTFADDLGMNGGDFAFILFRIDLGNIRLTVQFPHLIPFRTRHNVKTGLTEGAVNSFRNALTISFIVKNDSLISNPSVLKTIANLTQSLPFNSSKHDATVYKVSVKLRYDAEEGMG